MEIKFFNNCPNKDGYSFYFTPIFCFTYNKVELQKIKVKFYSLKIGWLFWFINITKNIKK